MIGLFYTESLKSPCITLCYLAGCPKTGIVFQCGANKHVSFDDEDDDYFDEFEDEVFVVDGKFRETHLLCYPQTSFSHVIFELDCSSALKVNVTSIFYEHVV